MTPDLYMKRCIELASKGGNGVRSNPHVGAVIVHNNKIIGEGYHRQYGGHHAEVDAIKNVNKEDLSKLSESTMYVSLEPCNHTGKTPPCVNAIIDAKIQNVVIGSEDPSPKMMGKSIELLKNAGIKVRSGFHKNETNLLRRRFAANQKKQPFITLKFAQSSDHFIGKADEQVQISNEYTSTFTHKLRAENEGILIGTDTAIHDNPSLTTRHYPGPHPLRIILDRNKRIPKNCTALNDKYPTLILTTQPNYSLKGSDKISELVSDWELENILHIIFRHGVHSLLVEGGAKIIKWFVKEGFWHDAHIITSSSTILGNGVRAPKVNGTLQKSWKIGSDDIYHILNPKFRG